MQMPTGTPGVRPNILLITTDQQRFDTIHAAGNCSIFTPHLNWLCGTGIHYSQCFSDCPVCGPSRATIMTGQHAWHHGETVNTKQASPMATRPTLPGLLTRAGYQTRLQGKAHFHPVRAHYGFESMEILPDYYRWAAERGLAPKEHGIGENEMEPVMATVEERHTLTHWTVDRSINFLETRDETRPFFLWTSFSKPHPPFDAPQSYWSIYDGISLPEPWAGDWSKDRSHIAAGFLRQTRHLNNVDRFSPAQMQAMRRAYYACISHVDYNLGLLFARMRTLSLLENTWIIFASDHGEMLGDHGMGAKSVFFQGSAHVPMIVRPPADRGAVPWAGTVDDRLVCLADVLPTCLHLAGVSLPASAEVDGINILSDARREVLYGECDQINAVITPSHTLHYARREGARLCFDRSIDPCESHDLIGAGEQRDETERLTGLLRGHLECRGSAAVRKGQLAPDPTLPLHQAADLWPGFHHRNDPPCDLLH